MKKLKEMSKDELMQKLIERYDHLLLLEREYDRLYRVRKKTKTAKKADEVEYLLRQLMIMQRSAMMQVDEIKDLLDYQVTEIRLNEEIGE